MRDELIPSREMDRPRVEIDVDRNRDQVAAVPIQPQSQIGSPSGSHAESKTGSPSTLTPSSSSSGADSTLKEKWTRLRQNPKFLPIAVPVTAIVVILLSYWIFQFLTHESTDDAYVTADLHVISPHINGRVIQLMVSDNQIVKKGDVLVKLDPRDYEVQLKIAQASLIKAQNDFSRWKNASNLEPTDKLAYDADQAALLTAEANLQNAQLQMEYTNVVAPEDGKIGARTVTTGEQLQAGQELMALVEERPWVVANFKENQLRKLRVGQIAALKVDAISGHTFMGKVESVSPGSGATFALLPPDNATGNFTKIVQRVPVKITFDADTFKGFEDRLTPGMSVEADVTVGW